MSKNKLAKFAELRVLPNVVEISLEELQKGPVSLKGNWNRSFFGNDCPLVLELGCGKGEYTVGLAEKFPGKNFIGIDIKGARIWTGAKSAFGQGLKNAAFLRTYVEMLPYFFDEGEVSEIWITFPDPQMKKFRKRLTSTVFLEHYSRVLKPGGIIHLKTDSGFLYQYTLELARLNKFRLEAETDDLYNSVYADEIMGIKTYYEQQWLARGIKIKYLRYVPHYGNLAEPETEIPRDDYRSFGRNERSRIVK